MNGLYSIGEVSKMTGLSIDTLRYYDNIGLLRPAYINDENHYRYYSDKQFWRIEVIRILRSMDMSIESIMELMTTEDDWLVTDKISQCLIQSQQKLNYYKKMVNELKWFKKQCQKMYEPRRGGIYEKEMEERVVVFHSLIPSDGKKTHVWMKNGDNAESGIDTIKKIYGFSLDKEAFYRNEYYRTGEYIYYPENKRLRLPVELISVFPKGTYICKTARVTRIPNDSEQRGHMETSDIVEYMENKGYEPKLILAQEIGVPLFDFKELDYEIQILV